MRDDTNERDALLNHGRQNEPPDARDDVSVELLPTHQALTQLAEEWSVTVPSAERLATFTRQLAAQTPTPETPHPVAPLRERTRREANDARVAPGRVRLLAGLVAAAIIVGLLSATLLRLSPGRTGRHTQPLPTAVVTPLLTARAAEEPSQQPPSASWATVARAQLIPAPSDGDVVYQVVGTSARVSMDGGATWDALTLPTLSQTSGGTEYLSLTVSAADPSLVLLTVQLNLTSANPADCPARSTPDQPTAMHGGILASGAVTCWANFISHDSGASWTAAHGLTSSFTTSIMWQSGGMLYGLVNQIDRQVTPGFPLVGLQVMASHDQGVTWSLMDSMVTTTSRYLCSFMLSPGDNALYAVTAAAPCFSGTEGVQSVMRSADGGASWRQVSTIDAFSAELLASTPTLTSHGTWIYMLREQKRNGYSVNAATESLLVSEDGGATWGDIPQPSQASASVSIRPVTGALSDGSLVVAAIAQTSGAVGATPGPATFYAWRPGDSGWRPLTTTLTANYAVYFAGLNGQSYILITHGGQHAVDTLWVIEARSPYGPDSYRSHAYPIR